MHYLVPIYQKNCFGGSLDPMYRGVPGRILNLFLCRIGEKNSRTKLRGARKLHLEIDKLGPPASGKVRREAVTLSSPGFEKIFSCVQTLTELRAEV